MKKYLIILFLLLLDVSLYLNKTKMSMTEVIDLKLQDNELAVTILSLENSKSILLNNTDLLVLEYIDSTDIQETLNLYNVDILDNLILISNDVVDVKSYNKQTLNKKVEIENVNILKNNNIITINYLDYSFCIYKEGLNKILNNCDFVYFLSLDNIDFSDEVLVTFFDSIIKKEKIEKYYDKWVDSYILNVKSFYTLKLLKDDYNVIEIPIK